MQKVNAAKEILTDPEKRKVYDQYGLEGMQSRIGNENFNFPGFSGGSSQFYYKTKQFLENIFTIFSF
jgi:DnaJ-class molecular chaperone